MTKQKPLMPCLKEKKRYMLIQSVPEIDSKNLYKAVIGSYEKLFGTIGLADASFMQIKDKKCIIKCSARTIDKLRVSLSLIKTVNNKKIIIHSVKTSGLINRVR